MTGCLNLVIFPCDKAFKLYTLICALTNTWNRLFPSQHHSWLYIMRKLDIVATNPELTWPFLSVSKLCLKLPTETIIVSSYPLRTLMSPADLLEMEQKETVALTSLTPTSISPLATLLQMLIKMKQKYVLCDASS